MKSKRISSPKNTKANSIRANIVGKELVIQIPLQAAVLSGSGKSKVVATTRGPILSGVTYRGKELMVIVNAFYYLEKTKT